MKKIILFTMLISALSANEIIVKNSNKSVGATMEKLENIVSKKGFTVFAHINHQTGANKVRMKMAPSEELIFGNPKIGTVLMQERPLSGLDLPLRVLVFEDKDGRTKIAYRDGDWLNAEHNLTQTKLLNRMNYTLDDITTEAGR